MFGCFFFSSRRRHTRSLRDWSSDVCSSDLCSEAWPTTTTRCCGSSSREAATTCPTSERPEISCRTRSEERRVGKECRARRSPYHEKKKRAAWWRGETERWTTNANALSMQLL